MLREQSLNREVAAWTNAAPVGRPSWASFRTVAGVLASALGYYVATQIAWALMFPRQQSLTLLSAARSSAVRPAARPDPALGGLRTRRRQRSFSGDAAGGLAAGVRVDLRGVRRREVRLGGGGDSHPDYVSAQSDRLFVTRSSSSSSPSYSFPLGPPSGVLPSRSPTVSAPTIGSNGATWASRMR